LDLAAGLAMPGAVLAGPSAARWHRIPVNDDRTWISVPMSAHPRLSAVRLLRGMLPASDALTIDGFRVTSRPRTVFDCLRVLPDSSALSLLDRALQQKWITMEDLVSRVQSFTGRRSVGRLARFVAEVGSGARSAAERLAIELFRRARIEGWAANVAIYDDQGELIGVGDLVFRAAKLVVELDGRAYHVSEERFEQDRYRQNRLVGAGWTVLRFTWRDLTGRPGYVVGTVRRALPVWLIGHRA
jgi:very-short-patch-repair endonuclease